MVNSLETNRSDHSSTVSVQRLPQALRVFLALSAALTIACLAVEAVCRWLGWDDPYIWPLMPWDGRFRDLMLYQSRFAMLHSPSFYSFDGSAYFYPAPMAVVHWLLLRLPAPVMSFEALLAIAFVVGGTLFRNALMSRGVTVFAVWLILNITAVCSYALLFEAEQANLEWVVCVLVVVGIWSALHGHGYGAAVCFGLAGSMKFYPLIFAGLLISRRQYRETAVAVATFVASTIANLWLACPDLLVSWHGMLTGLAGFRYWYMLRYEQVGFDHSLFALFKAAWLLCTGVELTQQALAFWLACYLLAAGFAGIVLYFDVIRKLPVVNQVLCLTVATILLPPVSYDYTLLHLYAPWALLALVAVDARERRTPGLMRSMVCMAVLLSPVTEIIYRGQSYGGQVKCVALTVLMGISLRRRLPSRFDDVPDQPRAMETGNAAQLQAAR